MLLVSHDEFFVSRIANRILELRPRVFRNFPGSLSDYRSYIEEGYIDDFTEEKYRKDEKPDVPDRAGGWNRIWRLSIHDP